MYCTITLHYLFINNTPLVIPVPGYQGPEIRIQGSFVGLLDNNNKPPWLDGKGTVTNGCANSSAKSAAFLLAIQPVLYFLQSFDKAISTLTQSLPDVAYLVWGSVQFLLILYVSTRLS